MSRGLSLPYIAAGSDGELFLFRALRIGVESGVLPFDTHDALLMELSRIASNDMDALVLRESHEVARETAFSGALHRASIGLEYAAGGVEARGADLLAEAPLSTAANTGGVILARLREQAEQARGLLRLTSDLPTALSILDELYLANTVEDMFLDELTRGLLTVWRPAPRLTEITPGRRIASLADIRTASAMLGYLDARAELFRSFPRERLFAQTYPTDALGGCDAVVICRMMVLVVTANALTPRFHFTQTDASTFRAAGDVSDLLRDWIDDYTSATLPGARQAQAREYMMACLAALPDLLDSLI